MAGNILEWCWDWSADYYPVSPYLDPKGPDKVPVSNARVLRGGSWWQDAGYLRVVDRNNARNPNYNGGTSNRYFGFRVARSAAGE